MTGIYAVCARLLVRGAVRVVRGAGQGKKLRFRRAGQGGQG